MEWIAVRIVTTREGIEPVCGRLYCLGVNGVQIEDAEDFEEFIESKTPHWDYIDESLESLRTCDTSVTAYLTADEAGANQLALLREGIAAMRAQDGNGAFGELRIELTNRDDEEWANNWKQYYKPFTLGKHMFVRPEWEQVDNTENRAVLVMNPGHLFGTGTHHSTRMCLEQLDELVQGGERVLDLGCGSGILSIAALLLGAKEAVAVDIDAGAPGVVGENLALNGIAAEKCRVMVGDVLDESSFKEKIGENFDIVVANIVADVIIALSGAAFARTRPGGLFVTSGIIEEREDVVADAIVSAGFSIERRVHQGGWSCLVCRRPL